MKKTLLTVIICGIIVAGIAFSQHTQSMLPVPSGTIFQQNDTFTVEAFLSFSGYSAYAFSFWLETPVVGAGFFHITSEAHFAPFNAGYTGPTEFVGCDNTCCYTDHDLGGSPNPMMLVPPGAYDVERMHFSITNAAPGVYTFLTTTQNPHPSIVTDQDFNDNPIPQTSFTITVVPEPGNASAAHRRRWTTANRIAYATKLKDGAEV